MSGSEPASALGPKGRVFAPYLPAGSLQSTSDRSPFDQTRLDQTRPQRRVRPSRVRPKRPACPIGGPYRTHGRLRAIIDLPTCTDYRSRKPPFGSCLSGAESQSHSIGSVESSIDAPFGPASGSELGAGWRAEKRGSDDGQGRGSAFEILGLPVGLWGGLWGGLGGNAGPNRSFGHLPRQIGVYGLKPMVQKLCLRFKSHQQGCFRPSTPPLRGS